MFSSSQLIKNDDTFPLPSMLTFSSFPSFFSPDDFSQPRRNEEMCRGFMEVSTIVRDASIFHSFWAFFLCFWLMIVSIFRQHLCVGFPQLVNSVENLPWLALRLLTNLPIMLRWIIFLFDYYYNHHYWFLLFFLLTNLPIMLMWIIFLFNYYYYHYWFLLLFVSSQKPADYVDEDNDHGEEYHNYR